MKKLIALVSLMTLGFGNAIAQEADESKHAVGADIDYATKINSVGFGVKYLWKVGKKKRLYLGPSIHYYIPKSDKELIDVTFDFKWAFPVASNFKLYPTVGIGYSNSKNIGSAPFAEMMGTDDDSDATTSKFCWNVGVGAQYDFSSKWAATFEARREAVGGEGLFVFGLGALYKF